MQLDATDWQILLALQTDARQSFTALGQQVGLSAPAVTERLRKLETAGIITGYSVQLNLTALGATIQAHIQLTTPPQNYPQVHRLVSQTPELLECHHLTGEASFLIRAVAQSLTHLEALLQKLSAYGPTQTALVLSTPVPAKPITPGIIQSGRLGS
ncbi:MAG: Lrp/AsnC family transcriptional regulator [Spirulinaceae cyanobacterium]